VLGTVRISELARRAGVTPRALRYYEEQGLLRPARLASGYRDYDDGALATVRQVRLLLSAGLGTAAIAEILACRPDQATAPRITCPELLHGLARERARITRRIDGLVAARDVLDRLVDDAPRASLAR